MAGYIGSKAVKLSTTAANVTGNITVGGNVDGRDVSVDGTKLDTIPVISTSSTASFIAISDGTTDGYIQLNCSANSHGIKLKSPPHSAGASYTLVFPVNDGDAGQVLKTDGSGVLAWVTTSSTDNTKLPLAGGAMTGAITTNSTFDGVDIATRDAILTSTTTTASAALPKSGGAMTGAITTNSTFDGRDVAADGVLATNALPKTGGAMTGAITTNSTFDGRDVAADGVLATNALPKAGGELTGGLIAKRARSNTGGQGAIIIHPSDTSAKYGLRVDQTANSLNFDYNTTSRVTLSASGNVGIGVVPTSVSGYTSLDIGAGSTGSFIELDSANGMYHRFINNNGQLLIQADQGNSVANSAIIHYVDGSERMRIDSSGNVLVGKTAESGNTAGHFLSASGYSRATRNGSVSLMNRLSSDGSIIDFQKDGSAIGSLGVLSGNNLTISGAVADHGGLQFGTHAVLPMEANADSNGTINLGGSGSRFKDAYLSGGVFLGGTGTANKISDYETGSFSPTYTWATPGNSSVGYSTRAGYYVKVGNLVHFELYFRMNGVTKGNASGSPTVSGLPFTAFNSGGYNLAAVNLVLYNHNFSTTPYAYVGSNSTNIGLERQVSGAATSPLEDASTYSFIWVTGSYRATT